jgi:16S rRNA (guanine527-N7)-methyltransferase
MCSTWNVPIPTPPPDNRKDASDQPHGEASKALAAGVEALGLEIDAQNRVRLLDLARMLIDWGRASNLTGHRDILSAVEHLVVGALALHQTIEGQIGVFRTGRFADLGSGAGFPGIPIAMMHPGLSGALIESREKRHHFQRAVRRELGVGNIEPRWGRIEVLAPSPARWVIAQAVAPPPQVLAWAMDWVQPGGFLVIPGGPKPPEPGPHPLAAECGVAEYSVPGTPSGRSLWWCRRAARRKGG